MQPSGFSSEFDVFGDLVEGRQRPKPRVIHMPLGSVPDPPAVSDSSLMEKVMEFEKFIMPSLPELIRQSLTVLEKEQASTALPHAHHLRLSSDPQDLTDRLSQARSAHDYQAMVEHALRNISHEKSDPAHWSDSLCVEISMRPDPKALCMPFNPNRRAQHVLWSQGCSAVESRTWWATFYVWGAGPTDYMSYSSSFIEDRSKQEAFVETPAKWFMKFGQCSSKILPALSRAIQVYMLGALYAECLQIYHHAIFWLATQSTDQSTFSVFDVDGILKIVQGYAYPYPDDAVDMMARVRRVDRVWCTLPMVCGRPNHLDPPVVREGSSTKKPGSPLGGLDLDTSFPVSLGFVYRRIEMYAWCFAKEMVRRRDYKRILQGDGPVNVDLRNMPAKALGAFAGCLSIQRLCTTDEDAPGCAWDPRIEETVARAIKLDCAPHPLIDRALRNWDKAMRANTAFVCARTVALFTAPPVPGPGRGALYCPGSVAPKSVERIKVDSPTLYDEYYVKTQQNLTAVGIRSPVWEEPFRVPVSHWDVPTQILYRIGLSVLDDIFLAVWCIKNPIDFQETQHWNQPGPAPDLSGRSDTHRFTGALFSTEPVGVASTVYLAVKTSAVTPLEEPTYSTDAALEWCWWLFNWIKSQKMHRLSERNRGPKEALAEDPGSYKKRRLNPIPPTVSSSSSLGNCTAN